MLSLSDQIRSIRFNTGLILLTLILVIGMGFSLAQPGFLPQVIQLGVFFVLLVGFTLFWSLESLLLSYLFVMLAMPLQNSQVFELGIIRLLGYPVHVYQLSLFVLLGSFIVRVMTKQLTLHSSKASWLVIAFGVWLIISTVNGLGNNNDPQWIITDWLALLAYLLLPIAVGVFCEPQQSASKLAFVLVGGVLANSLLVAMVAMLNLGSDHWLMAVFPINDFRVATASVTVALLPVLISLQVLLHRQKMSARIAALFFAGLIGSVYMILITASRTLWGATVLGVMVLLLIRRRKHLEKTTTSLPRFTLVLMGSLFAVGMFFTGYGDQITDVTQFLTGRLTNGLTELDLAPRADFYTIGAPLIVANPLGTGTGSAWFWQGRVVALMDNVYLTVALKYGFPGLFLLLAIVGIWLQQGLQAFRLERRVGDFWGEVLSTAWLIFLPVFLLMNFNTSHLIYNRLAATVIAIMIGWVINARLPARSLMAVARK